MGSGDSGEAVSWQPVVEVPRLPVRRRGSHKGDYGTVVVVGGSRGMAGAAVLAGRAALRSGAGLVRVACPADIWDVVAGAYPAYTTWGIPLSAAGTYAEGAAEALAAECTRADAVAIGPGLGRRADTVVLVRRVLELLPAEKPVVIDADGLYALSPYAERGLPPGRAVVLTPHAGEFARLSGWRPPEQNQQVQDHEVERQKQAVRFARQFGVVLLLKGSGTLVSDGERLYRNSTGNPGMATGGSGDVLTGMIAALLAQGWAGFEAAMLAAWVHGRAGDLAARDLGWTALTAPDLLDYLPAAWKEREISPWAERG